MRIIQDAIDEVLQNLPEQFVYQARGQRATPGPGLVAGRPPLPDLPTYCRRREGMIPARRRQIA